LGRAAGGKTGARKGEQNKALAKEKNPGGGDVEELILKSRRRPFHLWKKIEEKQKPPSGKNGRAICWGKRGEPKEKEIGSRRSLIGLGRYACGESSVGDTSLLAWGVPFPDEWKFRGRRRDGSKGRDSKKGPNIWGKKEKKWKGIEPAYKECTPLWPEKWGNGHAQKFNKWVIGGKEDTPSSTRWGVYRPGALNLEEAGGE